MKIYLKLWQKIKLDNGEFSNDIDTIIGEQVRFYESLFSSEGWDNTTANEILVNIDTKLTEAEKESLEKSITEDEIWKCVKQLKVSVVQ